jgi:hypothetical protein
VTQRRFLARRAIEGCALACLFAVHQTLYFAAALWEAGALMDVDGPSDRVQADTRISDSMVRILETPLGLFWWLSGSDEPPFPILGTCNALCWCAATWLLLRVVHRTRSPG